MRLRDSPPSVHYIEVRIAKTRKIEFLFSKDSNKLDFHFKEWDIISNLFDPFTSKTTHRLSEIKDLQFSSLHHYPSCRDQICFYLCHY